MRNVRKLAFPLVAVALAAAACSSSGTPAAGTPTGDPVTITIAISNATNSTYAQTDIAESLGYFKKWGINLKVSAVTSGSQTFTEMLAGQAQCVIGVYDHTIDLQAEGKAVESIMTLNDEPGFVVMVRTDESSSITSAAQLTGKKVGITGVGGSTQFIVQGVVQHAGGNGNGITPVSVQSGSTFVAAMENDSIDAGISTEPTVSSLLSKHDATILADMRTAAGTQAALGGPYVGTSLVCPTAWVNAHATVAQDMVNAEHEALVYIQQHSAAQIASEIPTADYLGNSKASYTQALANEIGIFSPTGLMIQDGPQSVLRILQSFDKSVQGKTINLSATYTNKFVQNVPAGD
jgi:NitT/TauT family transport system substrate-binding protein